MRLRWLNIITLTLGGKKMFTEAMFRYINVCITVFMFPLHFGSAFLSLFSFFLSNWIFIVFYHLPTKPPTTETITNTWLFFSGIRVTLLDHGDIAVTFPAGLDVRRCVFLCFCHASLTYVLSVYDRKLCSFLIFFVLFLFSLNKL